MLQVESLQVTIASVQALRGFSLEVPQGSMVGLVGRNGAGKTSLMRAVMGHLAPGAGTVRFDGKDLARVPRHARARLGIGYMPEDRGLVPELTVEENILVPVWASKTLKAEERLRLVYGAMPELEAMRDRRALLLSGGQQKMAALDEGGDAAPGTAGRTTVLFVEHDMEVVTRYAGRVVAFYSGRVLADGAPAQVLADAEVRRHVTGGRDA